MSDLQKDNESTFGIGSESRMSPNMAKQILAGLKRENPYLQALRTDFIHGIEQGDRGMMGCIHACNDVYAEFQNNPELTHVELNFPIDPTAETPEVALVTLMANLHMRGWNVELKHEFNTPTEEDSRYSARLYLQVSPGDHAPIRQPGFFDLPGIYPTVQGVDIRDHQLWTEAQFEEFWFVISRYHAQLRDVERVRDLVGNLSEGVLWCSYNQEEIRTIWTDGTLNEHVAHLKKDRPWDYERLKKLLGEDYRPDGDYESLLSNYVGAVNGWPVKWSNNPFDLDRVSKREWLKMLPEMLKIPGSRSHRLSKLCDLKAELEMRIEGAAVHDAFFDDVHQSIAATKIKNSTHSGVIEGDFKIAEPTDAADQ